MRYQFPSPILASTHLTMVAASLPPGARFLLHLLPTLFFPTSLAYYLFHISRYHFPSIFSSLWTRLTCTLAVYPLTAVVLIQTDNLRKKFDARRLGAKPLPEVQGKRYIGNVDKLIELVKIYDISYPGESTLAPMGLS